MSATRERLLDEAERLFADGLHSATTRQILDAAGQRNVSAVGYHFGSREGLVLAILARRGAEVDARRAALRHELGGSTGVAGLVRCLVEPYTDLLHRPEGRRYLRIVSQLSGRFAAWRVESDASTTRALSSILDELGELAAGDADERQLRVLGLIMVLTSMTAERAIRIDSGEVLSVDHTSFVAVLSAMCAGVVSGGVGGGDGDGGGGGGVVNSGVVKGGVVKGGVVKGGVVKGGVVVGAASPERAFDRVRGHA